MKYCTALCVSGWNWSICKSCVCQETWKMRREHRCCSVFPKTSHFGDKNVFSDIQMITPICKLVPMIGLSARSMNLAGKNLPKTIKGNYITSLLWIVFFCACYYWSRVYLILIVTFPCDVITPHAVCLCVPPLSSPPVSGTQYRFPLCCHNVNKQWISGTGCSEEQCQMYGPQEIQSSRV